MSTKKNNPEAVKTVANNEMTADERRKGGKEIVSKASTLGQVLKQLTGLYATKLAACDGRTVSDWFSACGVHRPLDKNGVPSRPYSPASIREGWHKEMLLGEDKKLMGLWGNLVAKFPTQGKNGEVVWVPVYTYVEACKMEKNGTGKPVKVWSLSEVPADKWSIAKIIRGIDQKYDYEKHVKRHTETQAEFDTANSFYIIEPTTDDKGNVVMYTKVKVDMAKVELRG